MQRVRVTVSLALAAFAGAASARRPPAPEEHVRGVVASVQGDAVAVASPDGRAVTTLWLAEQTRVSTAARADLTAIRKDGYVGVTAVEAPDGLLRALEVHVLPDVARGAGEGRRPWDLAPGSTLTNAIVSAVEAPRARGVSAGSAGVAPAAGGRRLELSYPGGKETVMVPPGVPVVRLEPADRSAIAAGERVFAAGARQPDGSVAVDRMVVGKGGAAPPM